MYAFAKIQTPRALEKLGALMRSDNEVIASDATERLEDLQQTATSQELRDLARSILASK